MEISFIGFYLIGLLISFILSTILLLREIKEENKLTLGMILRIILFAAMSWIGVFWNIIWIIADIAVKAENVTLWSHDKNRINRRTEKDS